MRTSKNSATKLDSKETPIPAEVVSVKDSSFAEATFGIGWRSLEIDRDPERHAGHRHIEDRLIGAAAPPV